MSTRRDFLQSLTAASLGLGLARPSWAAGPTPRSAPPPMPARATDRPPNIVVICADDHAQWATGFGGHRVIRTPNMDWLARTGTHFRNAVTPSPVCSPARACLFTGRLPSQHGVHDFLSDTPEYDHGWLSDEVLLPELLQSRGYRTGLVGKWHCTTDSSVPQRGFDHWLSYDVRARGWINQYHHFGPVDWSKHGTPITSQGYQSRFITDAARGFIAREAQGTAPFFLFAGYTDTHFPFAGQPERWASAYRDSQFYEVPQGPKSPLPAHGAPPADREEALTQYYAAVAMLDDQVGQILDALDRADCLDNTLIVYTSDHGHMLGQRGLWGKGNASTPQNFYDESIRIPCVMRGPGMAAKATQGRWVDHLDTFATLAATAGVTLDEGRLYAGQDLRPGRSAPKPWQICEYGNARMIADEAGKLVVRYAPHAGTWPDEYYDLRKDPREEVNGINDPQNAAQIATARERLDAHFAHYEDPAKSGRDILTQPPCNAGEPWRV